MLLNKKIMSIVVLISFLLSFSGCGASKLELQEQLKRQQLIQKEKLKKEKLKRQHEEKLKKEKLKRQHEEKLKKEKLKRQHEAKLQKEAIKYLKLKQDDRSNLNSLMREIKFLRSVYTNMYLTEQEKQEKLKKQFDNKKVIFNYTLKYNSYNPYTKVLYVALGSSSYGERVYRSQWKDHRYLFKASQAYRNSTYVNGQEINFYDSLYTDIPNTSDKIHYEKGVAYLQLKENCSAKEAKEINNNLAIRLVVTINPDKREIQQKSPSFGSEVYAQTYMLIAYNRNTNKIYKIFY